MGCDPNCSNKKHEKRRARKEKKNQLKDVLLSWPPVWENGT